MMANILLKILLLGDSNSCKSDLLARYTTDENGCVDNYAVGLDYKLKEIMFKGQKIKLQIWDTAGQERFRSVTSSYYRGSQGCLLAFNMRSMMTFTGLTYWLDEIKSNAPETFQTILVAVNCDESDSNEVSMDLATQFASQHNLQMVTVDLNDIKQIQTAFETVVNQIMSRSFKRKYSNEESTVVDLNSRSSRDKQACFC